MEASGGPGEANADEEVVDLRHPDPFSPDRVLGWLRRSSGSLYERTMKARAAELIERSVAVRPD